MIGTLSPLTGQTQNLPKWEVGVGLVGLNLPYYRGSEIRRSYLILYPHFIYRGERVRFDEKGLKSWLFQSEKIQLDFSLAAGLPVPSDQNSLREGMPALNPSVEIGPSLNISLWRNRGENRALSLILPLRGAFSIDLPSAPYEGWIFSPHLRLNLAHYDRNYWQGAISWGPIFADDQYHRYFYGVESRYASARRPAYEAAGGYAGHRLTLILKRKLNNMIISAFVRADSLSNAVFEESPLVASTRYHMVGATLTWILATSHTRANPKQKD